MVLFVFLPGAVPAQPLPLQGVIYDHHDAQVYFWRFNSFRYRYEKYDSARTDREGMFGVSQPARPGLYGLSFSPGADDPVTYLWLGEGFPVRFSMTKQDPDGQIIWQDDRTNGSARSVSVEAGRLDMRLSVCGRLLDMYPDSTGKFYRQVREEYLGVQQEMELYRKAKAEQWKGTATEHIIRQYYFALPGKHYREAERTAWLKLHFLDSVNFADTLLQNSHLLRDKIDQYFRLYGFPEKFNDAASAAQAVRPAVVILMQHCISSVFTRDNPALQLNAAEYVSGYLFQRFSYLGMDDMVDEVAAQVPDDLLNQNTCSDGSGQTESGIARILAYKKLFTGKPAPLFDFDGGSGLRNLRDVRSGHTLIIFWASWCSHCEEVLPEIAELYRNISRDQLEIIAVSVDTSVSACRSAIASKHYPWLSQCSGRGWNDEISRIYGITGTPTMFLLDEHKLIAGKPAGMADLLRMLKQ